MLEAINEQDRKLLEGLLGADRDWIERWYALYFPGIKKYVRYHGGNNQDAEDVFQEALLILYQKLKQGKLQLSAPLRTYLLAVCRNVWRSRKRRYKEYALKEKEAELQPDFSADIEAAIQFRHREAVYQKHFTRLGDSCQRILQLFLAKVKLAKIAERLNLSPNYVKKKKFTCKEQLIKMIQADPSYEELKER